MNKKILVTGGAGYIGSHATLALLEAGFEVVVLDSLRNSSAEPLRRIERLTGKAPIFIKGDILDSNLLDDLFRNNVISAVLHFAGLKAVGESVRLPLEYYENNVAGSVSLCQAMSRAGVRKLVFSSSATVYGNPAEIPIREDLPVGSPQNPYGSSKLMVERLLQDVAASDSRWSIAILRYFNPVGAHPSGLIGEDPRGIPNNLLPYISQVAVGRLEALSVFGSDYPTPDGTGIRDYIHVVDLVEGHLKALQALESHNGVNVWNLGTGRGYSVIDIIKSFERACGRSIPYLVSPRRPGDIAQCWADPSKASLELGWKATRDLESMMADTWRWQSKNPNGYES